jgi:hypothetical protein
VRRFVLVFLFLALFAPASAVAASWHEFKSGPLGLAVKYPATWRAVPSYLPGSKQVELGYSGRTNYSLTIQAIPIKPAKTLLIVMHRFNQFEQRNRQSLGGVHWRMVRVGGHPAWGTISRPATEGGVAMSEGLFVMQSRHHVYEITEIAYSHPPPASLARFPGIYGHILATLRFR